MTEMTRGSTPADARGRCGRDGCARLCTDDGLRAAYVEHRSRLLRRARGIVVDPHLAEEAVQEAFTRAWRACATFDPAVGPLVNWLLAITANIAIDLVKARRRRPPQARAPLDTSAASTSGGIDLIGLRAQLRSALAAVSEQHRNAVVETILLDRPYADVARDFGIKDTTLRTRVHYALRNLRSELESLDSVS